VTAHHKVLCRCAALLLVFFGVVEAQQPKIPRVGFLSALSRAALSNRIDAFQEGLRELGYVEGKNIVVEYRWSEGKPERLPALAAELVRLNVAAIVTAGPTVTRRVKEATVKIPIVMALDTDPVGNGFVASLGQPGGNITGLSMLSPEISGKRLELLKEIVPRLSRVAVLGTATQPGNAQALKEMGLAAETLGVHFQYLDVRDPKDIDTSFHAASTSRAEALLTLATPVLTAQTKRVIELAAKHRLPVMYAGPEAANAGGLMSYGVSLSYLHRRAALYVDKILKGAKPAELPVEQPTKFELVINLKTAKQIGLVIPPNVLARADKVIR
jgi:ABC-type uncharacterized transport system substrate-binding protein